MVESKAIESPGPNTYSWNPIWMLNVPLVGGELLPADPPDGRLMKRHGELLHVDWPAVKRMAAESRDHVIAKSGFKLPGI